MMELEGHQVFARAVSRALCPLLLALLPLLTACGSKERTPPPYEANPSPKEAYEVVITTHDAPEDIYASSASVTYEVTNDCLPPIDNFEGVRYGIDKHSLDIPLRKVNSTTYEGTYFRDGILNADYYGKGACDWEVVLVGATLKTDTTTSPTYFTISTTVDAGSETRYSSKSIKPLINDGSPSPADTIPTSRFLKTVPVAQRGDYFSYQITISPRKE
ncbi:hypothetical protein [Stenotrophomonas sp. S41]|uniref:hypothetical protein n=1 Tax=Stenotrophomonas sp. S41 TaxID=2767464 RepID=UPI00190B587F|nr:hypothetical protein [Stenotrophomonas sp. S41]MBK0011060.1 hypothetical protein [Stenotrophomonas sp. S41]